MLCDAKVKVWQLLGLYLWKKVFLKEIASVFLFFVFLKFQTQVTSDALWRN